MRINERCYVGRVVAGLWLLGWIAVSSGEQPLVATIVPTNRSASATFTSSLGIATTGEQNIVENVTTSKMKTTEQEVRIVTLDSKIKPLEFTKVSPKNFEPKTEGKKKLVTEFKVDGKYEKVREDERMNNWKKSSFTDSVTMPTSEKMGDYPTEVPNVPSLISGEPSVVHSNTTNNTTQEFTARGRALNISALEPTNSLHANLTDLSDVSMDDEDKEVEGGEYVVNQTNANVSSTIFPVVLTECTDGNKTYGIGEKIVRGCDETCICSEKGTAGNCEPLCRTPTRRAGRNKDPYCSEQLVGNDECCALLVCADSNGTSDKTCIFGNETLARGQRVEDGCSKVCVCEAGGTLKCQPRCPPNETTSGSNEHDRCVALTDPRDPCCTITLCDVTLGDHEIKPENSGDLSVNLTNVKVLNSTAILLKLSSESSNDFAVEISENNHVWRQQKPDKNGIISNLEPARSYFVRITEGIRTGPALQVFLPAEVIKTNITEKVDKSQCSHRGKLYKIGAEWYDECISLCICAEGAKTECVTIECPTDSGLDVLNPHCLDWETVPANFVPKAPQCCPREVRCRNNGSCLYEGVSYDNWSELSTNVTGCEKRCYCEMGNVSCQAACPPVTSLPPPNLQCPSNQAILAHLPGDDCCLHWVCDHSTTHPMTGMDVTSAYPLSTNNKDRIEKINNNSEIVGSQESTSTAPTLPTLYKPGVHGVFHYSMDPGHPTIAYNGPYNPDYNQPSIDQIFRLSGHMEKIIPTPKDKTKSKFDVKKPLELVKPHKESTTNEDNGNQSTQRFPGPLAPHIFPVDKSTPTRMKILENPNMTGPANPNKLPPIEKTGHPAEQPQFIPLKPYTNIPGGPFVFVPSNGESIPPTHFVNQYENPDAGPPYGGPALHMHPDFRDPNFVVATVPKITAADTYADEHKSKPGPPGKSLDNKNPSDVLPEELYHLINQQHPGLTRLEHSPPQGHPDLYEIHRRIAAQKDPHFGQTAVLPGNTKTNDKPPRIVSQKDENGRTTYHVHTSELPNSPQQIEQLLAHISQHDSNLGPFHRYRGPFGYQDAGDSPSQPLPPGIDTPDSSSSSHLNHPFAAHASPNQSGLDNHNVPLGYSTYGSVSGFPGQSHQSSQEEVTVKALEALDDRTIRIIFMVPSVFVGLQARVELRYTSDKANRDPSRWKSQIFIPPNDLIATQQLEFELDGLEPSTDYKVRVTVNLVGLANSPSSKIYSVRTLDRHDEPLPPQIPVDAELRLAETNSTWISVMWKKFTEYEMQFIDGVQLRYKEHDGKVYAATPLIHRTVTSYVIENLKPSTNYEIGISIIPFPGQTTELMSEKTIQVVTAVEPDPYYFDVKVDIKTIKSTGVEVTWTGVPYPEDKYVNIYRAIYQSDSGKEDTSTFKIAKRDSPAKTLISDLKPGTRYRLWIEVYLTNGRIKKSNVQDFVTKPGVVLPAGVSQQGKLASIPLHDSGDYYGPLVIVAIVASLAILSTLVLLMMLMKRRSSSKADISPRKTTAAYDNPSYKTCEDGGPLANGRNKSIDHEMDTIVAAKEST